MNRKEYIITSDLKIAQSQRNNTINRAVTTYHIGAKKLNKAQVQKLISNLSKLLDREAVHNA